MRSFFRASLAGSSSDFSRGDDGVVGDEPEGLLALLAPVAVDAEVSGKREDPGDQREAAVVAVEVLEDLQEDLLRQLLGVLPLQGEVVGDGVDLLAEAVHQLPPGVVFALAAAIDEALFFGALTFPLDPK